MNRLGRRLTEGADQSRTRQRPIRSSYKALDPSAPYAAGWKRYRKRQRDAIIAFLVSFGFCVVALIASRFMLAAIVLLAITLLGNRAFFSPCPRCQKPFHVAYGEKIRPLSSKCVHCQLQRWDPGCNGNSSELHRAPTAT
jgi:endogenous inhibitor of DNA gyrase (YacG/DUF329 family)